MNLTKLLGAQNKGFEHKMSGGTIRVSLENFAKIYIQYDALCQFSRSSVAEQSAAYNSMCKQMVLPITVVHRWSSKFREHWYNMMLQLAMRCAMPYLVLSLGPDWIKEVEAKLKMLPRAKEEVALNSRGKPWKKEELTPERVLQLIVSYCKRYRSLCSSRMYQDIRRTLRTGWGLKDIHSVWVTAQRVAMRAVACHIRRGDVPSVEMHISEATWQVADLVLLHTDYDTRPLITAESMIVQEQLETLDLLMQLVARHGVEQPIAKESRAVLWTKIYKEYTDGGRVTTIVILQRRWHELKLQARALFKAYGQGNSVALEGIHIQLAKRLPDVLTAPLASWRWQVSRNIIVTQLYDEKLIQTKTPDEESVSADDDVLLIEGNIETMDVESDTDTEDRRAVREETSQQQCNGDAISSLRLVDSTPKLPEPRSGTPTSTECHHTSQLNSVVPTVHYDSSNAIDELISMDPNKVKTEIIFESETEHSSDDEDRIQSTPHDYDGKFKVTQVITQPVENEIENKVSDCSLKELVDRSDYASELIPIVGRVSPERDHNYSPMEKPLKNEATTHNVRENITESEESVDPKLIAFCEVRVVRVQETPWWKKYAIGEKCIKLDRLAWNQLQTTQNRAKPKTELTECNGVKVPATSSQPLLSATLKHRGLDLSTSQTDDSTHNDSDYEYSPTGRKHKKSHAHEDVTSRRNGTKVKSWAKLYEGQHPPRKRGQPTTRPPKLDRQRNVGPQNLQEPSPAELDPNRLTAVCIEDILERIVIEQSERNWMTNVKRVEYCCLARRHRLVNDVRKRTSQELPVLNIHLHADHICTYCCAHLLDNVNREQQLSMEFDELQQELHALLKSNKRQHDKPKEGKELEPFSLCLSNKEDPLNTVETTAQKPKNSGNDNADTFVSHTRKKKKTKAKRPKKLRPNSQTVVNKTIQEEIKEDTQNRNGFDEWMRQKKAHEQYFNLNLNKTKLGKKVLEAGHIKATRDSERSSVENSECANSAEPIRNKDTIAIEDETLNAVASLELEMNLSKIEASPNISDVCVRRDIENQEETKAAELRTENESKNVILYPKSTSNDGKFNCTTKTKCIESQWKPMIVATNGTIDAKTTQPVKIDHTNYLSVKDADQRNLVANKDLFSVEKEMRKTKPEQNSHLDNLKQSDVRIYKLVEALPRGESLLKSFVCANINDLTNHNDIAGRLNGNEIVKEEDNHKGRFLYRRNAPKITFEKLLMMSSPRFPILIRTDASRELILLRGDYLILTVSRIPCSLPTYWTAAPYRNVARVLLKERNERSLLRELLAPQVTLEKYNNGHPIETKILENKYHGNANNSGRDSDENIKQELGLKIISVVGGYTGDFSENYADIGSPHNMAMRCTNTLEEKTDFNQRTQSDKNEKIEAMQTDESDLELAVVNKDILRNREKLTDVEKMLDKSVLTTKENDNSILCADTLAQGANFNRVECSKTSENVIGNSSTILCAFSDHAECARMASSSTALYLMHRGSGALTPLERVRCGSRFGLHAAVPKDTLMALLELFNNVQKGNEPAPTSVSTIIDITED